MPKTGEATDTETDGGEMAAVTPMTGVKVGVMVLLIEVVAEELAGTTNKGEVKGETDLATVDAPEVLRVDVVMSIGVELFRESIADATVVKTCFDLGDKSMGMELFCCSSSSIIIESAIVVLIIR